MFHVEHIACLDNKDSANIVKIYTINNRQGKLNNI